MLKRISLAAVMAVLVGMFAAATATAVPTRPATPPPTDFWQNKGFMNMAHQGGETEAPGNTLYAFKTAVEFRGADTLEMDGYLTKDGVFVITHDMEPHKTSNAPFSDFNDPEADPPVPHVNPENFIMNQTLAELKEFDFAYKFMPGRGHYGYPHGGEQAANYPYRGIATGDKAPPKGYTANDFKIPTFREVLDAFPDTPINVDMKAPGGDPALSIVAAQEVAKIMKDYPERSEDVIVASFYAPAMSAFHAANPAHKALTAGEGELLDYALSSGENPIEPTPVALQPPDNYNLGSVIDTVPILRENATYDGFAIHVWPQNGTPDNETTWQKMIDQGADGFFTDQPGALHRFLCQSDIRRPDGTQRCGLQAPDIVPCPEGTEGTAPTCAPIPPAPVAKLSLHSAKGKNRVKAGKGTSYSILVQNTGTAALERVKVCAKVAKKKRRFVKTGKCIGPRNVNAGGIFNPNLKIRTTRKARGKVALRINITSANGGKSSVTKRLIIKPFKKKRR